MNQLPTSSKLKLELDSRFECSICLEHLKDPVLTSCGHKFCSACIHYWMDIKHKNYCPIDEIVLKKEDIFPDNYTRREILEYNLSCPFKQCSRQLSIPNYETHVNSCYLKYCAPSIQSEDSTDSAFQINKNIPYISIAERKNKKLTLTVFPTHLNMEVNSTENFPCKYYQVGCGEVFKSKELLETHYDLKTSFHLELLFNQCCIVGTQNSTSGNVETRAVSPDKINRSSTAVGMNGENKQIGNEHKTPSHQDQESHNTSKESPNSTSFNNSTNVNNSSLNSSDSMDEVSPFTKNQKEIEAYLMKNKEQESKLWDPSKNAQNGDPNSKENCASCVDNSNLLKLLYERIVLLEQSKLELEIKVNKMESGVKQLGDIEDNVTLKLCSGVYYWKLDNFRAKLEEMKQTNRYFYSACFYSSCYGYRFCTRVNISREDPHYLSLFIHLVQGEHDDILAWPFVGRIRFSALNKSTALTVQDEIQSDKNFDSFKRPVTFFLNKKAFGFNNFIRISDVLDWNSGYLMEDETFVIRTQVTELGEDFKPL